MINPEFKVGDKIKILKTLPRANDNIRNFLTNPDEIYIVSSIEADIGLNHVIKVEGHIHSWYAYNFELAEVIQDNEFVKMMQSKERMIDLPI